jgi:chemotaxis protein CheX
MLGEEFSNVCDEVREAVGEIANMISGQTRQALSAKSLKFQASLPSVIAGKDLIIKNILKEPSIMIKFEIEKGPFEVGITMEGLALSV